MIRNIFILTLLLMIGSQMEAQNIRKHRWKDRLVLILTSNKENPQYLHQLKEVQANLSGIKERKLFFYHSTPNAIGTGFSFPEKWNRGDSFYTSYKRLDSEFEIILIGLDGGVKLRKSAILDIQELFDLIDSMPMRQAEMRKP